ncbi:MAG TPA: DUF4124 domain-containing protein [Myxococcota bacterium]|nr:DUF4124 domain-containing protein [Myxococcota bacterium]
MEIRLAPVLLAAALALPGANAAAQTLYKLIDRNGKVTYSETAPKDYDGKVIRIDIDPNANTATLPRAPRPQEAQGAGAAKAPLDAATRLRRAQDRLDQAQAALAFAEANPAEDEFTWVGNVGGGVRRVPNEKHATRLAALRQAVKEAEDELRKAQDAR